MHILKDMRFYFYAVLVVAMPLLCTRATTDPIGIKGFVFPAFVCIYLAAKTVFASRTTRQVLLSLPMVAAAVALWSIYELFGMFHAVLAEPEGNRIRLVLGTAALIWCAARDRRFLIGNRRVLSVVSLATACVVTAVALYQTAVSPLYLGFEYIFAQPGGTLGNHHLLGAYLLFNLGLGVALFIDTRRTPQHIFAAVAAAGCVVGIFASGSRSALISMALGVVAAAVFVVHRRMGARIVPAVVSGAVVLIVLISAAVFNNRINSGKLPASVSLQVKRVPLWVSSFNMGLTHPLLGWGTGSFRAVFPAFKTKELLAQESQEPLKDWAKTDAKCPVFDHADSEPLEIFCERGLVGIVLTGLLWGTVLFALILGGSRMKSHHAVWPFAMAVAVVSILFMSATTVVLRYPMTLILLAITAGVSVKPQRRFCVRLPVALPLRGGSIAVAGLVCLVVTVDSTARLRADMLVQKSVVYVNSDAPEKALASLDKARLIMPSWPDIHYKRGYVLYNLKEYKQAATAYATTVCLEPNFARAHYNLGCALYKIGDMPLAKEEFALALKLHPYNVRALHYMANIAFIEKDYKKAFLFAKRVLDSGAGDGQMRQLYNALLESGYAS